MHIDNNELYVELIISKGYGKLTKRAERMFETLAKEAIKKNRYWSNDDRNDCYQTGLMSMFQSWHNFNEEKSINPFAYFTEIFKRGTAAMFNRLHRKRGDNENHIKMISLDSSNDGMGLHSI
jgi:DNA-directed RNA polymerase specialized sigma24 family protein